MQRSVSIACAVLLLASIASAEDVRKPDERAERASEKYLGDVVIRTDGARILIMVDTLAADGDAPDGIVDQWFTLQGSEPFATPVMTHISGAYIVHSPGSLRISSRERDGERFHFGLQDAAITGVGLSHNFGDTTIRIADQLGRSGKIATNCLDCEVLNPDDGGGSSGSSPCSSGGPGSTSCSVSSGSNSCSVACASGYYACCYTLAGGSTYCRCAR